MRRLHTSAVNQLEDQARQILNMPQRMHGPVPVRAEAPLNIHDLRLLQREQDLIDNAAGDLRIERKQVLVPGQLKEVDDDWLSIIPEYEYVPQHTEEVAMLREDMLDALGEGPGTRPYSTRPARDARSYRSGDDRVISKAGRKAGLDVKPEEMKGLKQKDVDTINEARKLIADNLKTIGIAGTGATTLSLLASGLSPDGTSEDNLGDAIVATGLTAGGGLGGMYLGEQTATPRTELVASRQADRNPEADVRLSGHLISIDETNRHRRGRTGAAIGAGAGSLVSLISAMNQPEAQIYY